MARLPTPGSDKGAWGDILNDFLAQAHNTDGSLKPASITGNTIADNTISEAKLDSAAQTKLNATAGTTNLGNSTTTTSVTVTSSSGTATVLPAATTSTAGVLGSTDKTKLDGIATGATANSSDAVLLNRANHTGTQAVATITGLQTALDGKEAAGAVTAHTAASDPHPQYLTETSAGTTYAIAAAGIPVGGASGQVLAKDSATDHDVSWQTLSGGGAVDSVNAQTGAVVLDINDVVPVQTTEGGKVLGTDGTSTTWTTLPVTPPAVATTVYTVANAARPLNADIVFWIPDDPALADPVNAVIGDVVFRSNTIEAFTYALSDETTAITSGTAKVTVRAPYAMTITGVRASLTTASSVGLVTVDINNSGATILSTKLTIDQGERTSVSAATAAVISAAAIAVDDELTFDIDTAGASAAGLKVTLLTRRG